MRGLSVAPTVGQELYKSRSGLHFEDTELARASIFMCVAKTLMSAVVADTNGRGATIGTATLRGCKQIA